MKQILPSLLFLFFITGAWANGSGPVHNTTQDTYYQTIHEAVNAATENDVIEVAAGTYTVTSTIYITTNNLTLRNKEGARPIIQPCSGLDCPGNPDGPPGPQGGKNGGYFSLGMIHIHNADGVTLKGFEIKGLGDENFTFQYGVYITDSNNTGIYDNIITGFFAGIVIDDSNNQQVKDNTITENWYGVAVFASNHVNINDNNIFENKPNFSLDNGKGNGNGNGNGLSDLVYSYNTDIDATCNWWGTTDLNKINEQVINFDEGQGDDAIVFPFWAAKDGPCLQRMFKLEITTGQQNDW